MATADIANRHSLRIFSREYPQLFDIPSEESYLLAEQAIEWAASIEGEDIVDYLHNIRIIARRSLCEDRDMGLAASIVSGYQRHLAHEARKEAAKNSALVSSYVGVEGEKVRVKVRVNVVRECDSYYGQSYMYCMTDKSGNAFVWFSSGEVLETGSTYVLNGTVKRHAEYREVKQTTLTRCSVANLQSFTLSYMGKTYMYECETEKEAKDALKRELGLNRVPRGIGVAVSASL